MKEPQRLLTGSDELAKLVASAENDVLDEARVDKVWQGIGAAVGTTVGGVAGSGLIENGLAKLLGSTAAKVVTLLVVGGSVAVAVHHVASRPVPERSVYAPPVAITTSFAKTPTQIAPAPTVLSVSPEDLPEALGLTHEKAGAMTAPRPQSSDVPPEPRAEGLLLLRARQSLAADPQHTLDLVRQHEREFPTSQLVPERDKLRDDAIARGAK